jgi:hypothetical protein
MILLNTWSRIDINQIGDYYLYESLLHPLTAVHDLARIRGVIGLLLSIRQGLRGLLRQPDATISISRLLVIIITL